MGEAIGRVLAVAAAAEIAQLGVSTADEAVAYAVFVLVGTVGVAVSVVMYFALGDRAAPLLDGLEAWMGRNNAVIMSLLCLVIGAKVISDATSGFSS